MSVPDDSSYDLAVHLGRQDIASDNTSTVEPQSNGLHSYGKLGQPDTEIE